jgi:hypothetical protein
MYPEINVVETVNIAFDTNTSADHVVPLNLTNRPDMVRVKQVSVAVNTPDNNMYQVWSNIVPTGILAMIPQNDIIVQLDNCFQVDNFPMANAWKFQIQSIPTNGTGPGSAVTFQGQFGMMLEFIQFKKLPHVGPVPEPKKLQIPPPVRK